jgi:hypothetical protein
VEDMCCCLLLQLCRSEPRPNLLFITAVPNIKLFAWVGPVRNPVLSTWCACFPWLGPVEEPGSLTQLRVRVSFLVPLLWESKPKLHWLKQVLSHSLALCSQV